ncbi:class I SAM-dependent methyltransferase [Liberibacter crescens]|uniref:class I SAM-dependent methyltransferase n=1 Tax=Liberibacter crescens TaxID=1273132 RepID=UPI00076317B4|nr:class I SAM-dependent methyltransferase [Liberibacter crescens]AMC13419.1 TetR family transcriptional regulator [Liberibacter crescens]
MVSPLTKKIKGLIQDSGPIAIDKFFSLCLSDPEYGYYNICEPFGPTGDFITAPEISQLFGEMIAVFLVYSWQSHGRPDSVRLVELGPGRGTMMSDILRVIVKLEPALFNLLSVHLIEMSKRLIAIQKKVLSKYLSKIHWHNSVDYVPSGFVLLVANEFFDSIPIKQFVLTEKGIYERMVGLNNDNGLAFCLDNQEANCAILPDKKKWPLGKIFETSLIRQIVIKAIAQRLLCGGGVAVIIDYGHIVSGFGDTLQAVKEHRYDSPLAHPGEADLTSHVDFQQLAEIASNFDIQVHDCITQERFLRGLGIWQRANVLARNTTKKRTVFEEVERLTGIQNRNMGQLFKVLMISSPKVEPMPLI